MKKGQGMSLNVIIIAAVVLIVLIVLWAIFTGRMGTWTAGLTEQDKAAKVEADKFKEGVLAAEGACATGAACKSNCDYANLLSKESLASDKRCSTGLVCCKA